MSMKKIISKIRTSAMILCAAGMLFGSAGIMRQQLDYRENEKITEAAVQTAVRPKPPLSSPGETQTNSADGVPVLTDSNVEWLSSVNMDGLCAVNPEVIGWIQIPGTSISYPLLQAKDNTYYLRHAWDGTQNSCGAVYMDCRSSPDDWNAVIYGHNMRNGSIFSELRKYRDQQFMEDHPLLYILYDGAVRQYTLSAAFETGLEGAPYAFGPMDNERKETFAKQLKEKTGTDIPGPTVTLSTCTGTGHQTRWAVVFSLVSESQN